jgi:hypothetical protein
VDGYRCVIAGEIADPDLAMSTLIMYIVTRVVEAVIETVPGAILQIWAVMSGYFTDDSSPMAGSDYVPLLLSIMCSAAAAGFVGASISFDIDTEVTLRRTVRPVYVSPPRAKRAQRLRRARRAQSVAAAATAAAAAAAALLQ